VDNRKIRLFRRYPVPDKIHRSGWSRAVKSLYNQLHDENADVWLDDFVEATLGWDSNNERVQSNPWIGIVHLPAKMDPPFWPNLSPQSFLLQKNVQQSLSVCKGLFTLSKSLEKEIVSIVRPYNVQVQALLHPTDFDVPKFQVERFMCDPKVIQVGWWLRNFSSFYLLQTSFKKLIVMGNNWHGQKVLEDYKAQLKERGYVGDIPSVNYLENNEYDQLLTESAVFLDLIDSSANNAVLECIARGTPLLVNRLAAVEEYVGKEYPLFYRSLEEASQKLADVPLLKHASTYLLSNPIREQLTYDHFVDSFVKSTVYHHL
jgi:hypothetical protein